MRDYETGEGFNMEYNWLSDCEKFHRRDFLKVVGAMAEACRILGHLIAPFTPAAARALHEQLGAPPPYDERGAGGPPLAELVAWGSGPTTWRSGAAQPLFPRVELPADDPAGNGSAS